ncbi:endolytic transglycosylase MltG [Bacillus marinisedimentorum]|uniref:endolytic transglycosylase MltG n=1 Tax=Bacillus marinisedimentorum TaxID=1821260 RepID=UPI0007E00EB9|nr:endolytic transglycosylase MltG [Bacillus marinisedimentorum]
MQSILRSFAAGILASALVLAGVHYSGNLEAGDTKQPPLTMPDVQAFLKTQGMTAVSIKEWNEAKNLRSENGQTGGNGAEQAESESDPPERLYTLDISSGMTSRDIGDRLVNAGIIKNTETLDAYLREHDLATSIQIGTYSLSSKMSIAVIADIITGN